MSRMSSFLGVGLAVLLSLAGLGGFIVLLAREMNVFWLVLAPVIFAVYQIPAAVVYALWKRKHGKKMPSKDDAQKGNAGENPSDPRL